MVHGAVLESMVWCTILVLILISLRRSLILKLKGLIFWGYNQNNPKKSDLLA